MGTKHQAVNETSYPVIAVRYTLPDGCQLVTIQFPFLEIQKEIEISHYYKASYMPREHHLTH